LLLTFTRKMELLGATWDELDFERREWRIVAERMKKREPHIVPLSRQALGLFMELEPLACGSRFVFPHLSRLDRPMGEVTVNFVIRAIGYSGRITPHGLRATASTILNEQGWRPDVNVRVGAERNKSRASYKRSEYLAERREMMQAWADYIDALCSGADVIPLRA
jgi:integrase